MRVVLFIIVMFAQTARADTDKAGAEAAWEEGRRLVQVGDYAAACPKFEASEKLDPGVGTELNLADCYEHLGRVASAWAMFRQAAEHANRRGDVEGEKEATKRIGSLQPRLSKLTIQIPKAAIVGLIVTRNGVTVEIALLGTAIPVDPGVQKIECKAPGRRAWTQELTVTEGQAVVAAIPDLAIDTTTPIAGGDSELQITVAERGERYEIEVATAAGPLRCIGDVTHEHPCKLKAPSGPAVVNVRGTSSITDDLKLKGKPVLISVVRTGRALFYGGLISGGVGAVALGVGLYACSQRDADDIKNNSATNLTCLGGSTLGGVALVAGGALVIYDMLQSHHELSIESDEDDQETAELGHRRATRGGASPVRSFASPTRDGAVVGVWAHF